MALELLAAFLTFIAVTAFVAWLTLRSRNRSAADQRLSALAATRQRASGSVEDNYSRSLFRNRVSTMGPFRQWLSGKSWAASTALSLERAGVRLRVTEYVLIRLTLALLLGALFLLLVGGGTLGLIAGIAAGFGGFMLPRFYLASRTTRRQQQLSKQMVEALQPISNGLRSGVAFLQAVRMAAVQLPSPMADELNKVIQDTNLGLPAEEALQNMAERCGSRDMDLVVTTILIQRTAGGRLSEVLERIAETIRERERLQGEIRAMTSQMRLTANIMSVYPFLLGFLFFIISPDLMSVLWEDGLGRILLAVAVVLQVMAFFTTRRLAKLEV
jgi:tight adherence protein B